MGQPGALLHQLHRAAAGDGLDAPHSGGDAPLAGDGAQPDVAGAVDVAAAAELARELAVADGDDADLVAVLLAEERHGAEGLGGVDGHDPSCRGAGSDDLGVDDRSTSCNWSKLTGPSQEKSKRRRSGSTSEPACWAASPSTRWSAACRRWVAV